jgi:ribosomal protein S27E
MAHIAKTCPRCGYGLVTCTGGRHDTELVGKCGACGEVLAVPVVPDPPTVGELSTDNTALEAEVGKLRAELAELKGHVETLHAVTPAPLQEAPPING